MRIQLTAAAEGKTYVASPVTVLMPPWAISFFPGDKRLIDRVTVSRRVDLNEIELPSIRYTPEERIKATIHAPGGEAGRELLDLLQYFESLGAFWCGIRRIHWEESKLEWIPETEEDRRRLSVFSVQPSYQLEEEPQPLDPRIVWELLDARDRNDWLIIPLAFWRQGTKDLIEGRYASAIYQLYFFLEDLYGQGTWKGRAVKRKFKGSKQMRTVAQNALSFFDRSDQRENRVGLDRYLKEQGLPYTTDGLLELLVDMRGRLHHFSQKSRLAHAHPLNHHEFRPFAVLLNFFCLGTYPLIVRDGGVQ